MTQSSIVDDAVPLSHARRRRRVRATRVATTAGLVLAVGAAVAAGVGIGFGGPEAPAASTRPPGTATVTRQTLVDTKTVDAELGNGPTSGITNRLPGTLTWRPTAGTTVHRGEPLYRVDNEPVLLLHGELPAYRALRWGDQGTDVRQLEENLAALGYTGFTVDETYNGGTAAAVQRWQRDLGLDQTGEVEFGRIVFAGGDVRVDSVEISVGEPAPTGAAVLKVTGTVRLVTLRVEVADQRLVQKGTAVSVVLPDGTRAAGTITRAYTVTESNEDGRGGASTKVEAIISLTDPAAGSAFESASVDVVLTADKRPDVLTVPVAALVALAEGGYGLEVVDGSSSHYVAVKTGLFAGGRVEVSGEGLTEGMTVGMPA